MTAIDQHFKMGSISPNQDVADGSMCSVDLEQADDNGYGNSCTGAHTGACHLSISSTDEMTSNARTILF